MAWPQIDETLRLAWAQAFLWDTQRFEDEETGAPLARGDTAHSLWDEFATWVIRSCRERGLFSAETWGAIPEQLVAPDLTYVFFVYTGGETIQHSAGEPVVGIGWLMRRAGNQWLLAGSGRYLPIPGWPPTREGPLPVEGHAGGLPPIST